VPTLASLFLSVNMTTNEKNPDDVGVAAIIPKWLHRQLKGGRGAVRGAIESRFQDLRKNRLPDPGTPTTGDLFADQSDQLTL